MKRGFPSLARRGFVVPTRLKAAAYESASTTGARAKSWRASSAGPNAAAAQNLPLLRSRARDAIRNDPWAKTAIARLVSNTIGNGIQAHPQHPNDAVRKMQKQLWEDSCEEIDADDVFDMAGVQTLAARAFFSDGEVLVRRQFRSPSEGLAVPMQIRLLEGDLLPMEKNEVVAGGGEIVNGVEFNADGRRVAYHLLQRHPGEYGRASAGNMQTVRVPADEIAHVFLALRPGQVRGVPELSTVLLRLKSLDNFDDAVLFRQEVSNLFAGFITKPPSEPGLPGDPVTGGEMQYDVDGFSPVVSLEPGSMQELAPGEDVKFAEPPGAGTDYGPFMRQQLMAAAASVGMPYEVMTGDLRDVSDRVLRVILNEFRRSIEQIQWNVFIHQFCRKVWRWWVDACALSGAMPMADYYRRRRDYLRVRWVPQGWPYIHPVQDVTAKRMEIRSGLASRTGAVLSRGDDPEQVDNENAADLARERRLGIRYDTLEPFDGVGDLSNGEGE
ncbi:MULTISPECIES: phage portal protein [Burkholderia]|jgi:lambda family phage portal protein|uniref:phage portal protein n=1 Tax=Burkholderia TaxID=32008 RepID=UPI0005572CA7|nr:MULTISPECIES: phage portal protein [Burkholderia]KVF69007.1 portal protein [Burkholderia vietnamiensis]MCA8390864.1 phage portal protein [Burkholderia vietnamiensis]TCT27663.1 lambda family phage portal protein [Burkholderia vietnamiensis]SCZ42535.1 phage portal protein, lambda family [Burkholderia vietnamiensis]SFY30863.1 phage portal protein, lambda family [Burkholderia vietnamiensis]